MFKNLFLIPPTKTTKTNRTIKISMQLLALYKQLFDQRCTNRIHYSYYIYNNLLLYTVYALSSLNCMHFKVPWSIYCLLQPTINHSSTLQL